MLALLGLALGQGVSIVTRPTRRHRRPTRRSAAAAVAASAALAAAALPPPPPPSRRRRRTRARRLCRRPRRRLRRRPWPPPSRRRGAAAHAAAALRAALRLRRHPCRHSRMASCPLIIGERPRRRPGRAAAGAVHRALYRRCVKASAPIGVCGATLNTAARGARGQAGGQPVLVRYTAEKNTNLRSGERHEQLAKLERGHDPAGDHHAAPLHRLFLHPLHPLRPRRCAAGDGSGCVARMRPTRRNSRALASSCRFFSSCAACIALFTAASSSSSSVDPCTKDVDGEADPALGRTRQVAHQRVREDGAARLEVARWRAISTLSDAVSAARPCRRRRGRAGTRASRRARRPWSARVRGRRLDEHAQTFRPGA